MIVIIGAGITGLSAAWTLEQARQRGAAIDYVVLEASDRVGGNVRTVREGDFLIDTGPDGFVVTKPAGAAICKSVGLGDQLVETIAENRRTYVVKNSGLVPMPEGMLLVAPTDFRAMAATRLVSWPGKIRAGIDLFIPKREEGGDESIASFVRRRLGREMAETFAEPMLAGIYAGDPEQLSIKATFPMLLALEREHGSIIRGAIEQRRKRPKTNPPPSAFLSLRNGMGSLPAALASKLAPDALRLNTHVTAITRDGSRWRIACEDGRHEIADDVVLSVPPNTAARLLEPFESGASKTLGEIPQLSTATGFMAWPRTAVPHALDASGFIVPGHERLEINASTWVTSKWPNRAPEGHVLIRVFFGGARHPEHATMDDDALVAIGRRELKTTLGITEPPLFAKVFRYKSSNPQPTVGHVERMADVHARCAILGGVWVTGGGYDGVGIPDCAKQGESTANKILERAKGAAA